MSFASKMDVGFRLLVALLVVQLSSGHICLLAPRQRGDLDVSTAGSHTCTRHSPPCGGEPVGNPSVVFTAGQTAFIQWQQNLNHYEPGYPGYMDLSIADSPQSTNFKTLAVVSDHYVFAQWYQKNFTALLKLPNMTCEHCVLRARYNAHKPGETPFLQCADVKIVGAAEFEHVDMTLKYSPERHLKQQKMRHLQPLKRALRLRGSAMNKYSLELRDSAQLLYGFAFNPFEPLTSKYISVNTVDGQIMTVRDSLNFGVDSLSMRWAVGPAIMPTRYIVDEVVSVDFTGKTVNLMLHTNGTRDDAAGSLLSLGLTDGRQVAEKQLQQIAGDAINFLSWHSTGNSTAFRIRPAETEGNFYFESGLLDSAGNYVKLAQTPSPESLYVNFQWLEADVNNDQRVYALLGNENAPEALNTRIYTFDLFSKKFVKFTELDVTKYTFMAMHSYPGAENLYAFSPGLWSAASHAWTLVAVDPSTGAVSKQCDIAPPGIFQRYYGGSVHRGRIGRPGLLYHVLRVMDSEADMIVAVDPRTCAVTFSEATNLRHVHSLVLGPVQ